MDFQRNPNSNRHSFHSYTQNEHRKKISVIEVACANQRTTLEADTPKINNTGKLGHKILIPTSISFSKVCYWNLLYLLVIIVACIIMSMPLTTIPFHNSIKFSWYWWEPMIPAVLSYTLYDALNSTFHWKIFKLQQLENQYGKKII